MSFFESYTKNMANMFIHHNIDYLVTDALEDHDVVHDVHIAMADTAIELVKKVTGKEIIVYDFNIGNSFNHGIHDNCIQIELDETSQDKKLQAILQYHKSIFSELKQNLAIDQQTIERYLQIPGGYAEIKKLITIINPDFFKYEYLHPAREIIHNEDYNKLIVPIKEKLHKLFFENAN